MEDPTISSLLDPTTWTFDKAGAHLPAAEVAKTFSLITYLNAQLESCHAVKTAPTP